MYNRYKRRYRRYKPRYKRRYRSNGLSLKRLNYKINKVASNVKPELKAFDKADQRNPNATADVFNLTNISQGDTKSTRDGDSCQLK